MIDASRVAAAALLGALLAGCAAPRERFVLLPQADGRPSALILKSQDGKEVILDQPYAQAVFEGNAATTGRTDAATVTARYGSTLAAIPPRPEKFVLYFDNGSDALTADSASRLPAIEKAIAAAPAAEIVVTGHTDRVGRVEANDSLAEKRARAIRERLIAAGVPAERIVIVSRGEREPLVPTREQVAEPRNRRVEVKVR